MADVPQTEKLDTNGVAHDKGSLKRRGLFSAVWAAMAGLVLKDTTEPVRAANGDPILVGNTALGSATTSIECTSAFAFIAHTTNTSFPGGVGVEGVADSFFGCGVRGRSTHSTGSTIGVVGESSSPRGIGVLGANFAGGVAVLGELNSDVAQVGTAVYGRNLSSYTGSGPGGGGYGVFGYSSRGHGVVGTANTAGAAAVVGATNGVADAYAAVFYGPVVVVGDFAVRGAKSAAVPHPDGSHRRLYCVESPESWFEDFGKGQLSCGQAHVAIDPDLAAVATMEDYHVFLTAYHSDHLLHVTNQTPSGFSVQAKDPAASGRFSWRVVAKRKDVVAERFAPIEVPSAPIMPEVPVR